MKLPIKSFEMWRPVQVKNKTVRTLSNGVVIPTWDAMLSEARKI